VPAADGREGAETRDDAAAATKPSGETAGDGPSSEWTGQTLFGAPSQSAPAAAPGLPQAGPTRPWLAKPARSARPGGGATPAGVTGPRRADDGAAAAAPRKPRRRAPSEPGTVLKQLAADIGGAVPEPALAPQDKWTVARTAPSAPDPAPAQLDVATVVSAGRRLDDLSRRLNDVEQRAEAERLAAVRRLHETEQQLTEARGQVSQSEELAGAAEARAVAAEQRAAELERELDAAVGLLAEHENRHDELAQQVADHAAQLAAERHATAGLRQQAEVAQQALAAQLESARATLAEVHRQPPAAAAGRHSDGGPAAGSAPRPRPRPGPR
jgi:hypothetical protein